MRKAKKKGMANEGGLAGRRMERGQPLTASTGGDPDHFFIIGSPLKQFRPGRFPVVSAVYRQSLAIGLVLSALFVFAASPLPAQHTVSDLVTSFQHRGRTVRDLVVDHSGTVHVAWTIIESQVHDPGTLFYSRLDRSGSATAETQITKSGPVYDVRIDLSANNEPVILYVQMKRLYVACFDGAGVMQTGLDNQLTPEETDARFEISRDESENLYLIGRGTIDYFWKIDPSGKVLDERRGRWIRQATPGFVCQLVGPSLLLFVWSPADDTARPRRSTMIQTMKFDLGTFSQSEPRTYDLGRVSEARESGIVLSSSHLLRSGRDVLFLASTTDSGSETRTYRVRFNSRGDPVRRWDVKHIYHLQADSPEVDGCAFRTGVLLTRRQRRTVMDLQAIGRDGNIYHLTSDLPALNIK